MKKKLKEARKEIKGLQKAVKRLNIRLETLELDSIRGVRQRVYTTEEL